MEKRPPYNFRNRAHSENSLNKDKSENKRKLSEESPESVKSVNKSKKPKKKTPIKSSENKTTEEEMITKEQLDKLLSGVDTINEVKSAMENIQKDITVLKNNQAKMSEEIKTIRDDVAKNKEKITKVEILENKMNQISLANEAMLFGLPRTDKANIPDILQNLSQKLEIDLSKEQFHQIYLVSTKKNSSILNMKFKKNEDKAVFLKKFKEKKPVQIQHIVQLNDGDTMTGKELSVAGKLTKFNRELMAEARRHSEQVKYVWEKDGKILITTANQKTREITSKSDIFEILQDLEKSKK
jgi:hypothetical protein